MAEYLATRHLTTILDVGNMLLQNYGSIACRILRDVGYLSKQSRLEVSFAPPHNHLLT